jgi:hypothetical protein
MIVADTDVILDYPLTRNKRHLERVQELRLADPQGLRPDLA